VEDALAHVTPVHGMISRGFKGMHFEDWENEWLDGFMAEAWKLKQPERDIAIACISQACIAKRPFGAFHRANLYFRKRRIKIRNARKRCNIRVTRDDCFSCNKDTDVTYADPPFVGRDYHVDYLKLYHFVEGLSRWTSGEI